MLLRSLSIILNINEEGREPYFFPAFTEISLSFSQSNLVLAISMLFIAFIIFIYVSCIHDLK